mmetsp:Transcript_27161/g.68956  ORF Transcript_27161/g.68956 Transcript_27161/m.68956 type:complete len:202 (+) Transcript_27161:673-1278(+)
MLSILRVAFIMSLLRAFPCMRDMPMTNSSIETSPSPSSRSSKMSGSSSMSMSRRFIIRMKSRSSMMSKNSPRESMPLPSSSISMKILFSLCCHLRWSIFFCSATASSSAADAVKAFITTTAVIRLTSTMPQTPRWIPKRTADHGMAAWTLRTILFHVSKVMSWNSVNMALGMSANWFWTTSSSSKSGSLAMTSRMTTAPQK